MEHHYWFTSELFQVQKGEDEETNPGCYGKELGTWLCSKFKNLGYKDVELIPEDWGWCVMCSSENYMLWVGCGSMINDNFDETYDPDSPPKASEITWHAFPVIEVPIVYFKSWVKKLLGKFDVEQPLSKLNKELAEILNSEPKIVLCNEP
jgi:hypothetical protein